MSKHLLAGASAFALLATMSASPALADPPSLQITINEKAASPGPVVGNHTANDQGGRRANRLEATGNTARGLLEASQNNGSNNALTTATGVQTGGSQGSVKTRSSVGSSDVTHAGTGTAGDPDRANTITGSLTGFRGVATIRQNNGDGNDMGAATGLLVDTSGVGAASQSAITDGMVQLDQRSFLGDTASVRQNTLDGTLNGARGVVTVQQNNGSANAVSSATAVGVGMNQSALSQQAASLGIVDSTAALDPVFGFGAARGNQLNGSLTGAQGLFSIQQNNGDGNVLGTTSAVNVSRGAARLDQADQGVTAASNLRFGFTLQGSPGMGGDRSNAAAGMLTGGTRGVVNGQQNNGDSNAVTAANGVNATPGRVGRLRSNIEANAQTDSSYTDALGSGTPTLTDRGNTVGGQTGARFQGLATLQQNNGDTNSMAAAAGVQMTGGGDSTFRVGGAAASTWLSVVDTAAVRGNVIDGSFARADGVAVVQQNNGDANALAAGTGVGIQARGGDVNQNTDAGATIAGGTFSSGLPGISTFGGERSNAVTGSFGNSRGLVSVQQNNGDGNALNAANSLFTSLDDANNGTARQQTRAGAASSFGETLDSPEGLGTGLRNNGVTGSAFNGASGIANVQQNNGSNNALSSATSVAADRGGRTAREASTTAAAEVSSNTATARRAAAAGARDRNNRVNNSFSDFRGAATVQQNNGDGNALSSATGMTASTRGNEPSRRQAVTATANVTNPLSPLTQDGVASANGMTQAFNGASGLGTVQQNNGNGNAVASASAFDSGRGRDARQTGSAAGRVASVVGSSDAATRNNRVERSFGGAQGVFTVQQNAGDGNGMGVANGFMMGTPSGSTEEATQANLTVDSAAGSVVTSDTVRSDGGAGLLGTRGNTADRAFNDATGVATLQQNGGNGNSINAGTMVQADTRGSKRTAQAGVRSKAAVADNETGQYGQAAAGVANRNNSIDRSLGKFQGVATVQQNGGDGNALTAGSAVTVARRATDAGDVNRGTVNSQASVERSTALQAARTEHQNAVTNSANGATGILGIQQNTGNNNAMSASTAVAAAEGRSGFGAAVNVATLSATVADNRSAAGEPGSRSANQVSGSFQGLRGLSSLQQNNGHNNAMQSAITVTATY